jgi:hypothetical protein
LFCGIPTGHLDEGYWQTVMSNREVFKLTEAQIDRKEVALTRFFIFRIAMSLKVDFISTCSFFFFRCHFSSTKALIMNVAQYFFFKRPSHWEFLTFPLNFRSVIFIVAYFIFLFFCPKDFVKSSEIC